MRCNLKEEQSQHIPMMALEQTLHGFKKIAKMVLRGVSRKQIPYLEIESYRIFGKTLTLSDNPKSIRNSQPPGGAFVEPQAGSAVTCKVQRRYKISITFRSHLCTF